LQTSQQYPNLYPQSHAHTHIRHLTSHILSPHRAQHRLVQANSSILQVSGINSMQREYVYDDSARSGWNLEPVLDPC
jgi:hypothetical protein